MRLFALILTLLASFGVSAQQWTVSDPVVYETPPGARVTGGFFLIENHGSEDLVISSVSSPTISRVELHLSFVENDVAKMEEQKTIVVEAGKSLAFKHGSYHIMFMDLSQPIKAGDTVDVVLQTSAGNIPLTMPVRKRPMGMMKKDNKMMKHGEGQAKTN